MLRWVNADSSNWYTPVAVGERQRPFTEDRPTMQARAFAYRKNRSRSGFFFDGETAVGMAVFYDGPEHAAYVIGGFLIDERFQGQGYGRQAAALLLDALRQDGRYSRVTLCCSPGNVEGMRFWEAVGFRRGQAAESETDGGIRMWLTLWPGESARRRTLHLADVDPCNWRTEVTVREDQQRFVATREKLLARAFAFLDDRSQVRYILAEDIPVGMALWYDYPEGNAYALIEFFIDAHHQGRGYGSQALALVLDEMRRDGRYSQVIICYIRENEAARRFWAKHGFVLDPGEEEQDEPIMRRSLAEGAP